MAMLKKDVVIGNYYVKMVSSEKTVVRVLCQYHKGWRGVNIKTGREIYIKSAAGLTQIPEGKLERVKEILKIARTAI